jgi:LuxR family maltose regulon positive regulatory protein
MEKAERSCTWAPEGVRALWARIWLWRARVERNDESLELALAWAHGRDVASPAEDDWELQSMAQTMIAGHRAYGEPDLAPLHGILNGRIQQAEAAGRDDEVIQLSVLEALALHAEGEIERAMVFLERALGLAAQHRYTMTFVQHGAPMAALLREAAARGISAAYVDYILSALTKTPREPRPKMEMPPGPLAHRPPQPSLLEPLSERELQVLRLLSSSLTGPQIADQLSISVGTFRSHTKSIYGKLAVHNRTESVARGRALGILPAY